MKTKILLLTFFILSASLLSRAAIISVVNGDNLQTKITNATAGDVLKVAAGNYASIVIDKQLTFIGTGYFLPAGGPGVGPAIINGNVEFTDGSANSMMSGFQISQYVYIGASNIVFSRNFVNAVGYTFYVGQNSTANKTVQNVVVKQNYMVLSNIQFNGSFSFPNSNFSFKNNIVVGSFYLNYGSESSGVYVNNTFGADINAGYDFFQMNAGSATNTSFYNNIFCKAIYNSSNYLLGSGSNIPQNFLYNILSGNGTPELNAPNTNLINQDKSTFFIGYPSNTAGVTTDAKNILLPGSPASSFGKLSPYDQNAVNTDAGAFGGEEPYVQSGIPIGPYVYKLVVPTVAANNSTIQIQVKAKTNN